MQGVKHTGILSEEELASVLPPEERLTKGAVAVIECVQEIPCNPCEKSCPFGAITVGGNITSRPVIDWEKCRGCGICVSRCPGLAIFVVDQSHGGDEGLVMLPHEYWPVPAQGNEIYGLDRAGKILCRGKVIKVSNIPGNAGTTVITVSVPMSAVQHVRAVKLIERSDVLICRCSEVAEQEVRQAVREGASTVAAVKLRTRAGMGLCQGRTCRRLISRIIAEETGQNPQDILPATVRPPVRTVALDALAGEDNDE